MKKSISYEIKELGFVPPKYGGVSVSISRLIHQLTKDGFSVGGFYTKENKDLSIRHSRLFDLELNLSTKKIFLELPRCFKILRPYKIIHSHYSLEHMIYIWCFLKHLHKKIVITVHNSMVQNFYSQCDPINRFFLKRVASHPDVTWVAVSEQAKDEMLKLPIKFRNSIHVIPAYIPDGLTTSGVLPEKLQDYITKHEKIIVFYGHSFMYHNGMDIYGFADALSLYAELLKREFKSIGFVLCLTENREAEKIKMLHDTARKLSIDDKIYWQLEPIENMKDLLNRTDVYIRPTCTDGDSLAVREALDLGAQVVASDVCPRPLKTIKYKYGDLTDFVNKVEEAIIKGHSTAIPDYNNYNKLKALYTKLLNS